ncbi:MAG: UPF0149 family protein [Gammaproteobacteria bacterium]|jgi:uncharacterized protein|nr:UPF0149 family protein [Gammaproteobacteria bacterium]
MTASDPILSDEEIVELHDFLASRQAPGKGMDLGILDGFLTAVLLNPDPILPSQWLPWVWDIQDAQEAPAFSDLLQARRITDLIIGHYDTVARSLDEDWYEPLFYGLEAEEEDAVLDAESWAIGFMLGVRAFVDPWWRPLIEQESDLLEPMVLLGTEEGLRVLAESGDRNAAILELFDVVPDAVAALYEHFAPMREQADRERRAPIRRAEPKIGRNDPCPCGSGKKYKKCCGAGGGLH